MKLSILLVDDESKDLDQIADSIQHIVEKHNIESFIEKVSDFNKASDIAKDPKYRFDLVISDTYINPKTKTVGVYEILEMYRNNRFVPIILYSSAVRPDDISESIFVKWADKGSESGIKDAVNDILYYGIPQISRKIHDIIDGKSGEYLWHFLEKYWDALVKTEMINHPILERLIRKRAAILLSDIDETNNSISPIKERTASEYYIYPSIDCNSLKLGNIIKSKNGSNDLRVILTPHCLLHQQTNQGSPRAELVLTVKTVNTNSVITDDERNKARKSYEKYEKKLNNIAQSPSKLESDNGRFWLLPGFLEIPDCLCDFQYIETIDINKIKSEYEIIASLSSPYAEAIQHCFVTYYSSIGIDNIDTSSFYSILSS